MTNLKKLVRLLMSGQVALGWKLVWRWLYSDATAVGLRRELSAPIKVPAPRMALTIRPIQPRDIPAFLRTQGGAQAEAALVRANAMHLLETDLATCFVAETERGDVCFMQYLVLPDQNAKLPAVFGGLQPPLEPDEALIEFAFTLEPYRAQGVMPWAMGQLAERARDKGARWLVTYIDEQNRTFLKFYQRLGFRPFRRRLEKRRFLRRHVAFAPISERA